MDHIFQLFDQPGIEYPNPPHKNPANPLDPDFFDGVLQIPQNQLQALHIPSETVLIEILGRRLRNEPINEIWINQINFYQHSPATLGGISFQAHNGTFFFITPIARCGLNRINRTIEEGGSWSHAGGRVKEIMDGGHRVRSRRSYHYKPPAADADRWLMKEYTVYPLHEMNNFAVVKLHR
ncbi:NAC domain-containing 67-like [Olea europaea subsp. europaea]|uniref:NAC domain-containing 67-like n=1 Tax=Olea europaea subsp. europaea TaxID=158383 RepID=A0A8S0S3M8_OLEEU|nr:NAC domain-containing 67-like [Olea europaea subsp. europaea]